MGILLKAPSRRPVSYGPLDFAFHVDPDGTLDVPRFAVPELVAQGCTRVDGNETIDVRAALAAAEAHELGQFLRSRGVAPYTKGEKPGIMIPIPMEDMRATALKLFDQEQQSSSH